VDARFTDHKLQTTESESGKAYINFMNQTFGNDPSKFFIRFEDQVHYKYIVSLDGNISAWERVVFALNMGSVLLYHTYFVQFFTPYLKENVHYIGIRSDMSDLKEKIDYLRSHPDKSKEIIHNAQNFASKNISTDMFIRYYVEVCKSIANRFEA
jgi:hypothetical protein